MAFPAASEARITKWDFVAIALYFILVLLVGIYSVYKMKRGSVSGYFLAGRFTTWLPIGASIFASNIGSEHIIGLAGSGAASGIGVAAFELNACVLVQLLGWVFIPVFLASKVSTLPEFMTKRFGGQRIRIYLSLISLLLYIFTKLSVNMYSGSLFINQALGWNIYSSVIVLLFVTAISTIFGGLKAVLYTDTLQSLIVICGASLLTYKAFEQVGGYEALQYKYMRAIPSQLIGNSTCGYPTSDSWIILQDPKPESQIPWPALIIGQTPASIWYWCADQMMVQRALSAKSLSHAQGGTLFAGYLKILPLFIMVMPGMVSRVLYTDEVACVDPDVCERVCGSRLGCSNIAYPRLVLGILPEGLRGIMMAVMLAALMSDLSSVFNSASTLFTMDIWPILRKRATVNELLIVGRMCCFIMVAVSIAWIPVIQQIQGAQLFIYIQTISAYLAPPIACVYVCAIFWKRMNEKGAFYGLCFGFVVGIIRMILDFTYTAPECGQPDLRPSVLSKVHYLYFAIILFTVTLLVSVLISVLTEPPTEAQIIRTTFWTRYDDTTRLDDPENLELMTDVQSNDVQEFGESKTIKERIIRWLCGYSEQSRTDNDVANLDFQAHLKRLSQLKQDSNARMFLNVNLFVIIIITVFLFGFYSSGNPLE